MDISRDQIIKKDNTRITEDEKIDAFIQAKTKDEIKNLIDNKFKEKINQPKWWNAIYISAEDLNKDEIVNKDEILNNFIKNGIYKTDYIQDSKESGVTFDKPKCKENDYIIIQEIDSDEEIAKKKEEAKATVEKTETAEERLQKAMMY
jgi:hypothetical protein